MRHCHVCDSPRLDPVHAPTRPVALVSSNVQPLEARVAWVACPHCLTIQKVVDGDWQRVADAIYDLYDINRNAASDEPRLFDTMFGSGPRTETLLKYLSGLVDLPAAGKLLDIGCSNGNLLKSFHRARPGWELYGSEISDTWKDAVLALPDVRGFHVGRDITYPLRYDLITICHVLEHVPDPTTFLRRLLRNLAPGGRLVVIVPNIRQNPIDLLIADHCSHFDVNSLRNVIVESGLQVRQLTEQVIPKELIAIAGRSIGRATNPRCNEAEIPATEVCRDYFRLFEVVRTAAQMAAKEASHFGIMGSAIAAAWLAHELDGQVEFFVDEDEGRVGQALMGRPIVSFVDVPPGAMVFIPMSAAVAERIIARARTFPIRFCYLEGDRIDQSSGADSRPEAAPALKARYA
jgi:SAM-dependent methyltransferase